MVGSVAKMKLSMATLYSRSRSAGIGTAIDETADVNDDDWLVKDACASARSNGGVAADASLLGTGRQK